jgi:hypothetical protein
VPSSKPFSVTGSGDTGNASERMPSGLARAVSSEQVSCTGFLHSPQARTLVLPPQPAHSPSARRVPLADAQPEADLPAALTRVGLLYLLLDNIYSYVIYSLQLPS